MIGFIYIVLGVLEIFLIESQGKECLVTSIREIRNQVCLNEKTKIHSALLNTRTRHPALGTRHFPLSCAKRDGPFSGHLYHFLDFFGPFSGLLYHFLDNRKPNEIKGGGVISGHLYHFLDFFGAISGNLYHFLDYPTKLLRATA